ncbi:nitrite reductase large subunit NirB [Lewinella sp. JB7]|uniref:nitrite reductase large subunit NirB n=1 Tax=Lewinella sp. JB7 TaxID=2962887 RepID=UPI0020C9EF44|nr:nitrite reductase large subunit NirB [Lewinella sp. JB7]MCP9236563.1 nitrite reductase large subunit NirB [Lewinella sp. JB7]
MQRIVVIGNGMVGHKFCDLFARHPRRGDFRLTVFGEERRPAYDRVHLSAYFADRDADKLALATRAWYADRDIELRTGELVTELDPERRILRTHLGHEMTYDYLVLATGSVPFVPPVPGKDKSGVFVYRTIEDLDAILDYAARLRQLPGARATVMGGGLLGLEAARATLDMGLATDVVEFAPRLMPRQLDEGGAASLRTTLEGLGLKIHLSRSTTAIGGNGCITHLDFADGTQLETDLLIISAGIRPRDELARKSGIAVGPRGGIVADRHMRTSAPDVFVIGEAALYRDMIYGLVAPGYEMARVALSTLMRDADPACMPESIDLSTKLKLIGTDVASFGDCLPQPGTARSIVYRDEAGGVYKRINVSPDGRRLLGGILVGDAADYNRLHQIYRNQLALPPQPQDLILGSRGSGGGDAGAGISELPEAAVICSCENITKGQLCGHLEAEQAHSVKDLIACTGAGTGCGGCKPILSDLVEQHLKARGKVVRHLLCEHFPHTRQELRDLIVLRQLRTYDEALDELGRGHGCEVCRPALAGIFATVYAETANPQAVIQDTNDRFLANIQRNGTYSVVPRVPAGEITPDKLIAIGAVAKKFGLYTKITGGQRIDLFGARLDQLPPIWEELIAAGFESGHAYGKSLRTVKSCVGSTWCRYGMDESVSFAIEIEERYKGLRSPHKLKGGVSGCIRECAEARGKDFGLIAVEEGYNLYVCGNGGARPKHAVLLAGPIDRRTAVRYLDRFLMFYLRTAGPLVRTAKWLETMEGGIDYLRSVVMDDVLGIAAELETEMQGLVNGYRCEWKEVIEDPEMRARFRPFVNTDDTEELEFVPLRDQQMPKPW